MLGSPHDAEDVVQVTLRAWRALERSEPRATRQTWPYRSATNACLDELERRPRQPEPVQPYPDMPIDEVASPTYDPAARYAIREGGHGAGAAGRDSAAAKPPARGADSARRSRAHTRLNRVEMLLAAGLT
jgi:DNA-directed RNA polymerase specialized sigma24 family protein